MSSPFHRNVLFTVAVVVAAFGIAATLWVAADVFYMAFAGILVAVLLSGAASWLHEHTPLGYRVSLALFLAAVLGALASVWWVAAPVVGPQISELGTSLPRELEEARRSLEDTALGPFIPDDLTFGGAGAGPPPDGEGTHEPGPVFGGEPSEEGSVVVPERDPINLPGSGWLSRITGAATSLLSALAGTLVVLGIGIFMAFEPRVYRDPVLLLLPASARDNAERILDRSPRMFRRWFGGMLVSMTIVAVGSSIGLAIIGVPMPVALGLLTGALAFVPNVGPAISVIPPILIATNVPGSQTVAIVAFYVALQTVESNLLTPLIQKQAVRIPPALLLFVQVLLGVLSGVIGILLAAPLTAFTMLAVREVHPAFTPWHVGEDVPEADEDEQSPET